MQALRLGDLLPRIHAFLITEVLAVVATFTPFRIHVSATSLTKFSIH